MASWPGCAGPDLGLHHRQLVIVRARTTAGYQVFEGLPKSAACMRTIALDRGTIAAVHEHAHRQHQERDTAAGRWHDTGYLFTTATATPCTPGSSPTDWLPW